MEGYHKLVLITEDKFSFDINFLIFHNPCNSQKILFPRRREQDESNRHFVFHYKPAKLR